jgi:hypothetical protein
VVRIVDAVRWSARREAKGKKNGSTRQTSSSSQYPTKEITRARKSSQGNVPHLALLGPLLELDPQLGKPITTLLHIIHRDGDMSEPLLTLFVPVRVPFKVLGRVLSTPVVAQFEDARDGGRSGFFLFGGEGGEFGGGEGEEVVGLWYSFCAVFVLESSGQSEEVGRSRRPGRQDDKIAE